MSLFGAASMALALLVGCGDDDAKPASSQLGQSCVRTADCAEGLSCIANTCYKTPPKENGQAGESSTPPTPPVLGGEGESCTSRTDCADGLGCFNNRCTATEPMGDGGAPGTPNTGIQLGARGESCRVNGDCSKDLVCIPSTTNTGTGVCDLADFGITPTGMTCGGECTEAADCCQLPVALHTASIRSCEDIGDAITTGLIDCAAPATPSAKTLCFEQATYCECAAKTWACTANQCVYGTACVVLAGADVPTGCPTYSRIRTLTGLTCNADTLKCVGATPAKGCTTDAKCEGEQVFDSLTATDKCTAGECTCYAGDKHCYRKCARDIDCGANQVCDTKTSKLCVPNGACVNDTQCAVANNSLDFKCNAGTCARSCKVDRDCNSSGLGQLGFGNVFVGLVCGADGFCASVATDCDANTQCPVVAGLKTFCIDRPAVAGTTVSSSITD
jgi:hypothetical protein